LRLVAFYDLVMTSTARSLSGTRILDLSWSRVKWLHLALAVRAGNVGHMLSAGALELELRFWLVMAADGNTTRLDAIQPMTWPIVCVQLLKQRMSWDYCIRNDCAGSSDQRISLLTPFAVIRHRGGSRHAPCF